MARAEVPRRGPSRTTGGKGRHSKASLPPKGPGAAPSTTCSATANDTSRCVVAGISLNSSAHGLCLSVALRFFCPFAMHSRFVTVS